MGKKREVMYCVFPLHNIDFRERVDEDEVTDGEDLLYSVNTVLGAPPYIVRSSCDDVNFHCYVLTLEGMMHVVALCESVIRADSHGQWFSSALRSVSE